MFAAMAITIAPIAGCSGGTSGNSHRSDRPQRLPEHGHQSGRLGDPHDAEPERHDADQADGDLTAVLAESTVAFVTASAVPLNTATISAYAIRPNQM